MVNKNTLTPIEQYFKDNKPSSPFVDLFEAQDNDVDLKTELNKKEIVISNVIILTGAFLQSKGIQSNIFNNHIEHYLRLRVSLDRKSRKEFVDINKVDKFEDNLNTFSTFDKLKEVKS